MLIYAVVVERDDTVRVVSTEVVKETPQYYILRKDRDKERDWRDSGRYAFGYSTRIDKHAAFTSERAALSAYMTQRQRNKASAQAVIAQATKQIASANELLMHLPEEPQSADAVDPHASSTGTLTTRDEPFS